MDLIEPMAGHGETADKTQDPIPSVTEGAEAESKTAEKEPKKLSVTPDYQMDGHERNLAAVTEKAKGQTLEDPEEPEAEVPVDEAPVEKAESKAAPDKDETTADEEKGGLWDSIKSWFGGAGTWFSEWSDDLKSHSDEEMKGKEGWDKVAAFFGTLGYGVKSFFGKLFGGEVAKKTEEIKGKVREKSGDFLKEMKGLLQEFGLSEAGDKEKDFFQVATELAKEVESKYGIPYKVVVAQACLESGNGTSGLTQKALNCFGMKGSAGEGIAMDSKEFENGKYVSKKSSFKSYASLRDSFMDYGKRLSTNDRYRPAFQFKDDPEAFLKALVEAGYATTPAPVYVQGAKSRLARFGMNFD